MRVIYAVALTSVFLLAGCATGPMQEMPGAMIKAPAQNDAQVVFVRSSMMGSAISSSVYDVTAGTQFVGILPNGDKLAYTTTPGKHLFMVIGESADFLEANLTAGKTYYSVVKPRFGAFKSRFSMWPIRNDANADYSSKSSDFAGWQKTTLLSNTPASLAWFQKNQADIESKRAEYFPEWQKNSPEERAQHTLNPEDGQ